MLLKENFYKRRNEKAWSLWLLPLVILSCFVFSIQSFAQSSSIKTNRTSAISITREQPSAVTTEKNPYTSKQLKALILQRKQLKALIEKAGYISPSMVKSVAETPSEFFAYKASQNPAFLELLMEYPEILMRLATDIFPQLGWEKHPDLLKALIENAGPSVLEKIATNVLSQPHWLGRHPDLLEALIRKGNQSVLEIVAKDILSQRQWYGHPELIEALIEKTIGGVINYQLLDWIHKYILTQRYWRTHPRFIELLKGEKLTRKALRELKDLWVEIKRFCS